MSWNPKRRKPARKLKDMNPLKLCLPARIAVQKPQNLFDDNSLTIGRINVLESVKDVV